jgi:hypothetical protein
VQPWFYRAWFYLYDSPFYITTTSFYSSGFHSNGSVLLDKNALGARADIPRAVAILLAMTTTNELAV